MQHYLGDQSYDCYENTILASDFCDVIFKTIHNVFCDVNWEECIDTNQNCTNVSRFIDDVLFLVNHHDWLILGINLPESTLVLSLGQVEMNSSDVAPRITCQLSFVVFPVAIPFELERALIRVVSSELILIIIRVDVDTTIERSPSPDPNVVVYWPPLRVIIKFFKF